MRQTHLREAPSYDLADHPLPTGREEIYRFTPLARVPVLLDPDAPWKPARLIVDSGEDVAVSHTEWGQDGPAPVDRPSAIGVARGLEATRLTILGDVPNPVEVRVEGEGGAQIGQLIIEAEPSSKAVVVLRHTGDGDYIGNVAVNVGDHANLTLVSLQEWAPGANHAGWHQGLVGRGARYRHVVVTLGGGVVRLQSNVSYAGPDGSAELFGLHMTDGGQHHEHRLFVDQNQPNTKSRVDYRGALQGGAHSAWVGDVLIQAHGIDSYEQNRNLLLTPGCVADSVPNLEIETGDIVGAGHSSATGHFDDEQLFYLRSRGIPEEVARRLVVQGFFDEIIKRIGVPVIEARLSKAVDEELDRAEQENHG